jgi:uncharacterized protein with beta-barrel porin domain
MASFHGLRAWTARNARRLLFGHRRISVPTGIALVVLALWAGTANAQYTVTSSTDNGTGTTAGTLSYAIAQANANQASNPGSSSTISINLSSGSMLTLSGALPLIDANVTINGGGTTGLTISGNGAHQVFFVDSGNVVIENLTIANANSLGGTGGNTAPAGGGGGGGLGAGGALFVNSAANVTVTNVAFTNNSATGGTGGNSTGTGYGGGGGGGGFHGTGGSTNTGGSSVGAGGGGGGGLYGTGGSAAGLYGASGGGGEYGTGGTSAPGFNFGGGGGGGTAANQPGGAGNGSAGGAGGGTSGGAGGTRGGSGPVAGTTGGGGGGGAYSQSGANGGKFGGGGGEGYNIANGSAGQGGDFGGGGGANRLNGHAGAGGFGGGGGGGNVFNSTPASGGFGGGAGGAGGSGGNGGDGYGGAVFVRQGGTLTIIDSGVSGSSATAGTGGSGGSQGTAGSADGAGLYLMSGVNSQIQVSTGTQTVSDAIGGAGGITKTGSGTLALGGTNDYSGGTTVSAGTLSGSTTNLQGAITNNAAVTFNQTTDGTYAGSMTGSGTLTKTGAGALTLTGINGFTGTTEVSTGVLSINGSTAGGINVDSGATLGGSGTITGNVVNNGIVAPGDPTTLTVNGNFTQNSSANLQVQIDNGGATPGVNSSLLVVHGTASVAGTVEIQPAVGTYTNGTRFTFLEATTLSRAFSGLLIDNPEMHGTLSYDYTLGDAYFTLFNGSNFAAYAQTPNQLAVANYIDASSITASGPMLSLVDTLDTLSPAGVRSALDQMSGALYGSVAQTDLQSTTLELSFLTRRIAGGLSGVNGAPGGLATNSYGDRISPTAGAAPAGSLASSDLGSSLTVRGQNSLNTFWPAGPRRGNWNTWGFGYGLGGNASGTSNAAGLNYSLGGTVVGLESLSENQAIGVYSGYVGSHLGSYLAGQSVGVNGGQFGTYLRRDDGINYYILLGGMGADGYNARRLMQFGGINSTATANYGGWQSQLYLERGVTLQGAKGSIQPYAALQYLYVRQNSFTETGAGVMDLKVAGIDANSLRSLIGVRLAGNSWYVNDRPITPVARALWLHEFLSTNTGINAQFAPIGGTNFAVTGTSLGRDWAILGAGLNWNLGRGWQTYANYDAQVNVQQTFHIGSGGFQYSW